ncbi:inositol monophosphatase [Devosia sp. XJ19-1]|uniref:Inositol monophosphatase n=1 Tax=Devosia ureilytica TaxID=2952754 RepID=A0A9Q4AMV1_9HYPH|nr:inositol monophosphatase [Devosia ureilytica]MCP8883475.1 inositol monophosphatase [Devosia ureilytica]MCP8887083.1 inositol monophosphatase [Devosia ureilytica]
MNIDRLAAILKQAAQEEIMPRFRRLDEGMIKTKTGAFDLVTEADVGAERVITAAIKAHRPDYLVIGEEAVAANPKLLESNLDDQIVIFVDPVDGTYNFAGGLPLFAVMAAVVQNGEPVAGVIYDPLGGDVLMAEKGCGAFLAFPDGRMVRQKFADAVPLEEMGGLASTSFLPPDARARVMGNLAKVKMFANYRCAGHEYRLAAGGNVHFLMYNKLMPWDHVGGALIMRECGAHVAKFDGSAYRPSDLGGGLLVAPDQNSWDELRREVFAV